MLTSGCVYVLISELMQNQEVPPQLPSIQGTEPQRVNNYYWHVQYSVLSIYRYLYCTTCWDILRHTARTESPLA